MAVINAVCVYCGSSMGHDPRNREAADRFGKALGQAGIDLIYGGGKVGLMGVVADAALAAGGKVVGIIPNQLKRSELAHPDLDEMEIVDSMHERKRRMFERADAFVALPGGPGTLDETFEIITWRQLRLHGKPIVVVNEGGYWQPFVDLIDHIIEAGFARDTLRGLFQTVASVEDVLPTLAALPEPRQPDRSEKF